MGRLGLLVLNRGRWDDQELIPQWFVEQLEQKQTGGIAVNYDGPDDGKIDLDPQRFPEAPYGFMTWVNTDGDFYPGADRAWAWAAAREEPVCCGTATMASCSLLSVPTRGLVATGFRRSSNGRF